MAQLYLILSVVTIVALPMAAFQIRKRLSFDLIASVITGTAVVGLAALSCYGLYVHANHLGLPTPNPWAYGIVLDGLALFTAWYMGSLSEDERRPFTIKASALLLVMVCIGGTIFSFVM
jgi:hypothetical protein